LATVTAGNIIVCGMNHQTAPLAVRERAAFSPVRAQQAAEELRSRGLLAEAVILSTCNRSEIYGVPAARDVHATESLRSFLAGFHQIHPAQLEGALYLRADREAVEHLFRVAAGLDSMFLGEAEILGQVREAYLAALQHGHTGHYLNRLFQSALQVGKRVRSETEIGTRPVSAAYAGVKLAEQIFGGLRRHTALVVGAGTMAEQVAEHLRNRKVLRLAFANRSEDRARELAARFCGEQVSWGDWQVAAAKFDVIILAVGAMKDVLTASASRKLMYARENRPLFLIDLGVPRNVAPACAEIYNVYLYNLEDLQDIVEQNKKAREQEIPRAEALVAEQILKFHQWLARAQGARKPALEKGEAA
jgi:glutamyl-tRNA reductase